MGMDILKMLDEGVVLSDGGMIIEARWRGYDTPRDDSGRSGRVAPDPSGFLQGRVPTCSRRRPGGPAGRNWNAATYRLRGPTGRRPDSRRFPARQSVWPGRLPATKPWSPGV